MLRRVRLSHHPLYAHEARARDHQQRTLGHRPAIQDLQADARFGARTGADVLASTLAIKPINARCVANRGTPRFSGEALQGRLPKIAVRADSDLMAANFGVMSSSSRRSDFDRQGRCRQQRFRLPPAACPARRGRPGQRHHLALECFTRARNRLQRSRRRHQGGDGRHAGIRFSQ